MRRWVSILALIFLSAEAAPAAPLSLLVLGDSLTSGYGLPAGHAFTAQLEAALGARGYDVAVLDGGVSGDTSAGGRARLDWVLAGGADAVIVALGSNDVLRAIDPAVTRGHLDAILARLAERGLPILLAGMRAPQNLGRDYVRDFESIYPDLAGRHDALLYPFFLEGVAGVARLNQDDGIHPNREGVAVMVEGILPLTIRLVERARSAG